MPHLHITAQMIKTIPKVPATLHVAYHHFARQIPAYFYWRITCPLCTKTHDHGAGNILETPAPQYLGHRAAHCGTHHGDYYLIDADPAATTATAETARATLYAQAASLIPTAIKLIARAEAELKHRGVDASGHQTQDITAPAT